MPTLLQIDSSPRSVSVSSELTKEFADAWKAKHTGGTHIHINTSTAALPYVDEALIGAYYTPEDKLTPEQKQHIALSDKLVAEFVAADTIVIGLPMWNFGVPASFKAWIDLVVRRGKTFRGGYYTGDSPSKAFDQQEPYIRTVLGFVGLKNIHFIHAENQGRPDAAPAAKALASAAIVKHFA